MQELAKVAPRYPDILDEYISVIVSVTLDGVGMHRLVTRLDEVGGVVDRVPQEALLWQTLISLPLIGENLERGNYFKNGLSCLDLLP